MKDTKTLCKRAGYFYFCIIGFLFVFFYKTGKNLADGGNIIWDAGYTCLTLGISLVLGGLLGSAVCFLFYGLAEGGNRFGMKASAENLQTNQKEASWTRRKMAVAATWHRIRCWFMGLSDRKVFVISLVLTLLSWLPTYLAYYPGICAYDAPVQTGQIAEGYYIDHHPILHTMLIKASMLLGSNILGDTNTGIAVYTFLQMTFLAAAMSYGMMMLHRCRVKAGLQLLVLLACMLYPFHWFVGVSMTKDTVFSGFVLMFLVALTVLLLEGKNSLRPGGQDVILFIGALGIIYFRNNGKYAMLVPLFFLVLMVWRGKSARKLWARILLCCGGAFIIGNIGLTVLFNTSGAEQGDKREMLSMPIQQLARCMIYHGGVGVMPEDDNTMGDVDKALINDFILNEAYTLYQPGISDPVKRHTNTYVVRYRTLEFARTYLGLLTEYPGDFINAALAVNAGFLYADDETHAHVNEEEGFRNKGYVQTRWAELDLNPRGIYKDSKWEWLHSKLEKWSEDNAYLDIPLLKYLFVPGVFLWYYLILGGYLLIRRKFRMWLPISFVGGYYLTMFLGPTVQLRYIYPIMIVLPFLILLCREKDLYEDAEHEG